MSVESNKGQVDMVMDGHKRYHSVFALTVWDCKERLHVLKEATVSGMAMVAKGRQTLLYLIFHYMRE